MSTNRPSLSEVLDDAVAIVPSVSAPWLGLLWLTALPLRLIQGQAVARVAELGPEAGRYGTHLAHLATAITLCLVVALWGRAVFVRAVHLRLRAQGPPGMAALRVPMASLSAYVYAALAIEVACLASIVAVVPVPVAIVLGGLAAATAPLCLRPSLIAPWREILSALQGLVTLGALLFVFTAAWLLAVVNLFFAFRLGVWLAGGLAGLDVARWDALLGPSNLRFWIVLVIGGAVAVEPFWLAALTVYVHKLRARASGDDLRLWFDRLRSSMP